MEYDFKKIRQDLRNMRGRIETLEDRKKKFSFPNNISLLAYSFSRDGNLNRYNKLRRIIEDNCFNLKKEYSNLRSIYSNRFDNHTLDDLLDIKQLKLRRLQILENRREKLLSLKEGPLNFYKKKKLNKVIGDLNEEIGRRNRNINDLLHEVESDRGLSFEIIYTQKLIENLKRNDNNY